MVAFISRYCTMAIIEVIVLSQYPDMMAHMSLLNCLCVRIPYSVVEILAINITIDGLLQVYDQSEYINVDLRRQLQVHHLTAIIILLCMQH